MKNVRLLILMGIVLLFGGQFLFAQNKGEKEQLSTEVKEMIDGKQFTIDVNRALPMGDNSVNLTSSYSFELKGDSAISYLPYYGRAYSVPYGGGDGLRFEKPIAEYECSYDKKGVANIKFVTRTDDDRYRFSIQIYPGGSAYINVSPTNKQSISFQGELAPKKEEKK
ncbi:MAG: hypothetical protein PARBA_02095 [Parabacteroides sp.]